MGKALSKTQKKTDNTIRLLLTDVCERALEEVAGFEWLTHQVDYANFPASLLITCVFRSDADIASAASDGSVAQIKKSIQSRLLKAGIVLKKLDQQVILDSEEACARAHDGSWSRRLEARAGWALAKNRPH